MEELIKLRQDHDTGAAVSSTSFFGIIARNRLIFATASGSDMRRIETILFLQDTDNGSSALNAKIPVVFEVRTNEFLVVGVTFNLELDVGLCFQHSCNLAQNRLGRLGDRPATALEEQLVGDVDVNNTFLNLDVDVLVIHVTDSAFQVHCKGHVQAVLVSQLGLEVLNKLVLSAEVIQRFFDAFCLRAGNDTQILQLFKGSVVILFQEIDLLVKRVDLALERSGLAGILRGEVITIL